MTALGDYLGRAQALVLSLADDLTDAEQHEVRHLIDHDEVGEALRTLAWIIVEEDKRVPATAISAIRELSTGLVDADDLPPNLERHVADEI